MDIRDRPKPKCEHQKPKPRLINIKITSSRRLSGGVSDKALSPAIYSRRRIFLRRSLHHNEYLVVVYRTRFIRGEKK